MGFGLLFVPLVGGYLFVTRCHYTQFAVRRESGHRLVFRSAAVGFVLVALARVLIDPLAGWIQNPWPGIDYWTEIAPFPYIGTVILAFVLGPTTAFLVNRVYSRSRGAMRAVHKGQNSMELPFVESMESDSLVELTLQSGKVYAGWILNAGVAEPERKFIEMLPLASGFRIKENHRLRFTTNYAAVIFQAHDTEGPSTREDFRVIVPVSEVTSGRPFDFATYFQFQEVGTIESEGSVAR